MVSNSACLVDAMVLVDAEREGFTERLLRGHTINIAKTAFDEVVYYKDDHGNKHYIDLQYYIDKGLLDVVSATATEIGAFRSVYAGRSLGEGETESLALVMARGFRFCTADRAAVKAIKEIGCSGRWVALEELLTALDAPLVVSHSKYERETLSHFVD